MQAQTVVRSGGFAGYQYYRYDPLNRLQVAAEYAGAATPSGSPCSDGNEHWCEAYSIDAVGNRMLGSATTHSEPLSPSGFNGANQMTSAYGGGTFGYDGRGNLKAGTGVVGTAPTFAYDAENHQVAYCPGGGTCAPTGRG